MPISEKTLKQLPPKQKAYWTRAQEFVTKMQPDWEMAEVGTTEYRAWVRYFRKQDFKPHMLTLVERKVIDRIMVPAQFPEMFDSDYVDTGGLDAPEWQRGQSSEELKAKARAWLDRSDPVSARMVGLDIPPQGAVPGQVVNYPEFIAHCNANNLNPRPVGAQEAGGYLGRSEIDTSQKRRAFTETEKASFIEDAKKAGKEIASLKLSDAAQALLREPRLDDQAI